MAASVTGNQCVQLPGTKAFHFIVKNLRKLDHFQKRPKMSLVLRLPEETQLQCTSCRRVSGRHTFRGSNSFLKGELLLNLDLVSGMKYVHLLTRTVW